jgi:hypothetical protein
VSRARDAQNWMICMPGSARLVQSSTARNRRSGATVSIITVTCVITQAVSPVR